MTFPIFHSRRYRPERDSNPVHLNKSGHLRDFRLDFFFVFVYKCNLNMKRFALGKNNQKHFFFFFGDKPVLYAKYLISDTN